MVTLAPLLPPLSVRFVAAAAVIVLRPVIAEMLTVDPAAAVKVPPDATVNVAPLSTVPALEGPNESGPVSVFVPSLFFWTAIGTTTCASTAQVARRTARAMSRRIIGYGQGTATTFAEVIVVDPAEGVTLTIA
jgi:hypothetical protein